MECSQKDERVSESVLGLLARKALCDDFRLEGAPKLVTFLNPYSYVVSRQYFSDLKKFDFLFADGIMLVAALRLIGVKARRWSFDMTSLAPKVFQESKAKGLRVALIGGVPGIVEEAAECFKASYGDSLNFCCLRNGFFESEEHRKSFVVELASRKPDVVIVGMGTPLQERFLTDLVDAGWHGWGFTCGGFFHQSASKGGAYYPAWVDRLQLRWLYRMIDEPYLVRRYFTFYPKFLFLFLFDGIKYRLDKVSAK